MFRRRAVLLAPLSLLAAFAAADFCVGPVVAQKSAESQTAPEWGVTLRKAFQSNISGNTDEAYSSYRAALGVAEKAQDTKGMIVCLNALADFWDSRDLLQDQEIPRKRALDLAEKKYGKASPEYAQQLAKMGGWYAKSGMIAQAKSNIDQANAILKGPDNKYPLEKASCYIAEARLQIAQKALPKADESYKKALALQESKLASTQPTVLKTCREYASLLERLGRTAEAAKLKARVEQAKGPETSKTASGSQTGSFLKAVHEGKAADLANDRAKGFACWKLAVAEAEKRPDLDNQLPFALVRLGDEYRSTNNLEEAVNLYKRALALREKNGSDNTLGMARNLERLARCYNAENRWTESEELLKKALEIEQKVEAGDQIIATTMESLLPACMANKDTKHAEQIAKQLLVIASKQTGTAAANNKRMATGVLGSIYMETGRVDEGMKMMKELQETPGDVAAYKRRKIEIEKKTDQSEMR